MKNLHEILYFLSPFIFKVPRHLYVQPDATHDSGLQFWDWTKFAVMKNGTVVLWGKVSEEVPAAFHLYQKIITRWKKKGEVKGFCEKEHEEWLDLEPLEMKDKELLAVSCQKCRMIRLLDTETEKVTVAFQSQMYFPNAICNGEKCVMYMVNSVKGPNKPVLELSTEQVPITCAGPTKTILSGMKKFHSFSYIPSPYKLLVFSDHSPGTIRAVSVKTGAMVWEVTGEIEGSKCKPHGILFSPEHKVLLVADGKRSRVQVLHPGDGSHLQTIQLESEMGVIIQLGLLQNKLIVHHHAGGRENVSFITILHYMLM